MGVEREREGEGGERRGRGGETETVRRADSQPDTETV